MNRLICETHCGSRGAKLALLLILLIGQKSAWGGEPIRYFKVTKLATLEIYEGALIVSESTNLDKEIVIFDYTSQRKIGPLLASDGYAWHQLDSKPDRGSFFVLTSDETKKLRTSNPAFWTISTNTFAYISENEDTATIVSVVDLHNTNTLYQIKQSFGQVDYLAITNSEKATIKYSFDESGAGTKTLSVWNAEQNGEHKLSSIEFKADLNEKALQQFRTAVKE